MMQIFYALILVIILPFSFYPQAGSDIWFVTPTGAGSHNGTSRANAWSLAEISYSVIQPGDYVYFGQGTYGSFTPGKSGTPGNIITYMADPINVLPATFVSSGNGVNISNKKYIRIKKLSIRNSGIGVRLTNPINNVFLDSLRITKCINSIWQYGDYNAAGSGGPKAAKMDSVWIRWCYVVCDTQVNAQTDLISCYGGQNNTFLIGNYIENKNVAGDTPSGQHIDCVQYYNWTGNVTYANNYFKNICKYNSQIMMNGNSHAGYVSIWYNNVFTSIGTGVAQYFASGNGGQQMPNGRNIVINNTFYANADGTTSGTHYDYTDTMYFKNNLCVIQDDCGPVWYPSSVIKTNIDYNLWFVNGSSNEGPRIAAGCRTFSYWQGTGADPNGMSSNPLFLDVLNSNFSLLAGSPATNNGANLQSLVEGWGIQGVEWECFNNPYIPWSYPVPRGSNPTIGAWEFPGAGGNYPPNAPSNPFPANGGSGLPINLTMSWTCSDPDGDPLTYDIYFGTNNNPPLVSVNQLLTTFLPGLLNTNTTYYWRVVAKDNQGNSTSSSVWNFSTVLIDLTAPEVVSATLLDSVTLLINFSEPLEQSGAQNTANYSITNNINVFSASLTGSTVSLTTSTHTPATYTVTVNNITDLAGNEISSTANFADYDYVFMEELVQLNIVEAYAAQWFQNYVPPNSIDGITYYVNPESRWGGAIPMPDEIRFDLGDEKIVGQTRFSFVDWSSGRIYVYSVFTSDDAINWTPIAESVSSSSSEWTILDFELIPCRYIKLVSLSNNQSQWAGLYEAEIWGLDVVPVELTSFGGSYSNGTVTLEWVTASETNCLGFEVQRKSDTTPYVQIGFIDGNGTTTNQNTYNFSDQDLTESRYYYRLKEISKTGVSTYSPEIFVDIPELANYELMQNYPNPFNPSTVIRIQLPNKTNIKLTVYNMIGEMVSVIAAGEFSAGSHEFTFDASGLVSGVYLYRLETSEFTDIKKMVLLQ